MFPKSRVVAVHCADGVSTRTVHVGTAFVGVFATDLRFVYGVDVFI